MEIEGGDHFMANSGSDKDHATIGRYGIAWLKLYLDGDERYRDFIYMGRRRRPTGVSFPVIFPYP